MTRSELIDALRSYLNRPNLSDAEAATMIFSVEGEFNRVFREHPRNIRRTSFVLGAGSTLLPLPVDMMQVILLRTAAGTMRQYPADAREDASLVGNSYIMRGDCAEVFPTPTADTEFFLDYYGSIKPLAQNTDSNWISNYYPDLYLYGTLKESAVYLKDDQRLAGWTQEFLRRLDGVVAQGWGQNISTAPRIRIG